jgi:hypothetical protein
MRTIILLLLAQMAMSGLIQAQTKNKAPQIDYIMIDGKKSPATVYLNPGEKYLIRLSVTDPEKDRLTGRWALYNEAELSASHKEKRVPVAIPDMVTGSLENVMLDVPVEAGHYRLFLYVSDAQKNLATSSMPLVVLK